MNSREATFKGSEGTVFYRAWEPATPPHRIVIVVHGYAEHSARYTHVAEILTAAGSAVYIEDHLGHGHSDGERALITDFEHIVDDLGRWPASPPPSIPASRSSSPGTPWGACSPPATPSATPTRWPASS